MNFVAGLLMCIPLCGAVGAYLITRNPEAKKIIPKIILKAMTFFVYFTFIIYAFLIIVEGIKYLSQL